MPLSCGRFSNPRMPLGAPLLSLLVYGGCPNAIDLDEVRSVFDDRAKRLIVGQAGALAAARSAIESWRRRDQRDCEDRVCCISPRPSGTLEDAALGDNCWLAVQ